MKISCKKLFFIGFALLFPLLSAACVSDFDGSRTGNNSQLIMDYRLFNTTDSQNLTVEAGDVVHVEITAEGGRLSLTIQKDGEPPLYEKDSIATSDAFDLEAPESENYTVTVTGKRAKGGFRCIVEG